MYAAAVPPYSRSVNRNLFGGSRAAGADAGEKVRKGTPAPRNSSGAGSAGGTMRGDSEGGGGRHWILRGWTPSG